MAKHMAKSIDGKRVVEIEDSVVYKAAINMESCESNFKEMLNIGPEDSVSRVSYRSQVSHQSKVSGKGSCAMSILKEVINQAGLKAKAAFLEERQRKELEEIVIRQEKELLVIKAQIAEA